MGTAGILVLVACILVVAVVELFLRRMDGGQPPSVPSGGRVSRGVKFPVPRPIQPTGAPRSSTYWDKVVRDANSDFSLLFKREVPTARLEGATLSPLALLFLSAFQSRVLPNLVRVRFDHDQAEGIIAVIAKLFPRTEAIERAEQLLGDPAPEDRIAFVLAPAGRFADALGLDDDAMFRVSDLLYWHYLSLDMHVAVAAGLSGHGLQDFEKKMHVRFDMYLYRKKRLGDKIRLSNGPPPSDAPQLDFFVECVAICEGMGLAVDSKLAAALRHEEGILLTSELRGKFVRKSIWKFMANTAVFRSLMRLGVESDDASSAHRYFVDSEFLLPWPTATLGVALTLLAAGEVLGGRAATARYAHATPKRVELLRHPDIPHELIEMTYPILDATGQGLSFEEAMEMGRRGDEASAQQR